MAKKTNWIAEMVHYLLVFGVLYFAWNPVIRYFNCNSNIISDLLVGAVALFIIFVVTDMAAHKVILGE